MRNIIHQVPFICRKASKNKSFRKNQQEIQKLNSEEIKTEDQIVTNPIEEFEAQNMDNNEHANNLKPFSNLQCSNQIFQLPSSSPSIMSIESQNMPNLPSKDDQYKVQMDKILSFMESFEDNFHTIKMQQASTINTLNVLSHDVHHLQGEVNKVKVERRTTTSGQTRGRGKKKK